MDTVQVPRFHDVVTFAGGLNVMAATMMRPDLFDTVWAHYPFVVSSRHQDTTDK